MTSCAGLRPSCLAISRSGSGEGFIVGKSPPPTMAAKRLRTPSRPRTISVVLRGLLVAIARR